MKPQIVSYIFCVFDGQLIPDLLLIPLFNFAIELHMVFLVVDHISWGLLVGIKDSLYLFGLFLFRPIEN